MRRTWRRSIVSVLAVLAIGAASASSAAAAEPSTVPGTPVELSLGDSWAVGVGATVPSEGGYVAQLHDALQESLDCLPAQAEQAVDQCKQLQLVNLAVGGATTPTLIANQLPNASALLESRNFDANPRNDVELVTLHTGGNDVNNPILAACLGGLTATCVQTIQTELAVFRTDLDSAISQLRDAAGGEATIVIGTYDNPIPTCQLAGVPGAIQLAALVLEGGGPIPQGLHDIIRDVAADYDVQVAEVFGDLAPEDWVGGQDCLHPDDSGYDKVTDAFLEALGLAT
jgi:lysophospholipase L1-like esterase